MKLRPLLTCGLLFSSIFCFCQSVTIAPGEPVLVGAGILLPADSVIRMELLSSLRGWLGQKKGPDKENAYIDADELASTSVFMDEIRGVNRQIGGQHDTGFYKCYLTNVVAMDSSRYRVQFAYMGEQGAVPDLRACCTVMARQQGEKFVFSSLLPVNTRSWKTRQIGNCRFHYREELNVKKAADYEKRIALYDKKLTTAPQTIDFYCCDNFIDAKQLVGVDYKLDYNGYAFNDLASFAANHTIVVSGEAWKDNFNDWDPHDTWHERRSMMLGSKGVNRPVDEACAYLYGGSWRIYGWEDIERLFREYAAAHPNADWVALYKDGTDFIPPPKILKVSYAINALIIRQLEKEKGFPAVLELLTCGVKEKGDANYFSALKKLTGVDEAGYNEYVWKLIKGAN